MLKKGTTKLLLMLCLSEAAEDPCCDSKETRFDQDPPKKMMHKLHTTKEVTPRRKEKCLGRICMFNGELGLGLHAIHDVMQISLSCYCTVL